MAKTFKKGSRVKVVGVTDRQNKQIYGKVISHDPGGLVIIDLGDKVIGIVASEVELK